MRLRVLWMFWDFLLSIINGQLLLNYFKFLYFHFRCHPEDIPAFGKWAHFDNINSLRGISCVEHHALTVIQYKSYTLFCITAGDINTQSSFSWIGIDQNLSFTNDCCNNNTVDRRRFNALWRRRKGDYFAGNSIAGWIVVVTDGLCIKLNDKER